ncbi:MAG: DsbA family protein [Acidobacteriota bacterium]
MNRKRALLILITILAVSLGYYAAGPWGPAPQPETTAQAGAAQPSSNTPSGRQYREGLNGVDFSGLDAAGKERALDLMNANRCDCGCGMSIAKCRVEDSSCSHSPVLASKIIAGIKAGKTDKQIVASLGPAPAPAGGAAAPAPNPTAATIHIENAPTRGVEAAKVTIVEFADFQCPFCARAMPVAKQLLDKYPNDVRYVFKQLPLTQIHPFADGAARASVAAANQGKFWEMHDLLFNHNRALDQASLKKYAKDLGLDVERFTRDMADPDTAQAVRKDVNEAQQLGVRGTPTFFINGFRAPAWDINTMTQLVEKARSGDDLAGFIGDMNRANQERAAAQRRARRAQQEALAKKVFDIDLAGAPIEGNPDAQVTIVEFGDFQCPFCANSQPLIKQVLAAYPDKVRLAFKHLPLSQIHPNARAAAIASLAALEQGKFWEMRDLLYKNHGNLTRATLMDIARQVGLDMKAFEAALDAQKNAAVIDKDITDSQRAQVTGTPTYFINGKRVMSRDFATFKRMIDAALNRKSTDIAG